MAILGTVLPLAIVADTPNGFIQADGATDPDSKFISTEGILPEKRKTAEWRLATWAFARIVILLAGTMVESIEINSML